MSLRVERLLYASTLVVLRRSLYDDGYRSRSPRTVFSDQPFRGREPPDDRHRYTARVFPSDTEKYQRKKKKITTSSANTD